MLRSYGTQAVNLFEFEFEFDMRQLHRITLICNIIVWYLLMMLCLLHTFVNNINWVTFILYLFFSIFIELLLKRHWSEKKENLFGKVEEHSTLKYINCKMISMENWNQSRDPKLLRKIFSSNVRFYVLSIYYYWLWLQTNVHIHLKSGISYEVEFCKRASDQYSNGEWDLTTRGVWVFACDKIHLSSDNFSTNGSAKIAYNFRSSINRFHSICITNALKYKISSW